MKRLVIIIFAALIVSILHLQVFLSSIGDRVEPWALDFWFNLRGVDTPPEDIAIVAMDESSYSVLKLPMDQAWPRALHAQLIERLKQLGAKKVVFDILFLGPSTNPTADKALSEAFKSMPTVIGTDSIVKEMGGAGGSYALEELLQPPEMFSDNVETIALVKMTEEFGYIRRFFVERSITTRDIPTLYESAAGVKVRDPSLPGPRDLLWYYGPATTIPTYPYHQILNPAGKIPENLLKNKVVFVGLSFLSEVGPAQKDSYRTAFDKLRATFGIEIQATAAANILQKKWVSRASKVVEGFIMFFASFLLCLGTFYLKPQWGALIVFPTILVWCLLSFFGAMNGIFIPGLIFVLVFFPAAYLISTFVFYIITLQSQQKVERAFQYYLSPTMAKQMSANPNALALGGESVYATALFSDIAGFSAITENMNANDVSKMLNAYFTEVMDEIFERQGTLIKFIGDAVFAIWGAPIKMADHAKLACETALIIQKNVQKFNASKRFPALHTRIGLHTGPMLVGNLGSARRFDYTAIGDSVNLASRLEGINKYFGTLVLISDATRKEIAGTNFYTLALGVIRVAGKKERVGLNVLLETPIKETIEKSWLQAISAFRNKKWDEAEKLFQEIKNNEPLLEEACKLYLTEIPRLRDANIDDDWQGEVEFSSK
jgi:adenylate cyclase